MTRPPLLAELCLFIVMGFRHKIGRRGGEWRRNHSNRINLTERNGNAVRSWDRWSATIRVCVCVCFWRGRACTGRHLGEGDWDLLGRRHESQTAQTINKVIT